MKWAVILMFLCCLSRQGWAQRPVIDVIGMRQLVDQSKTEYGRQVDARNNQAVVNVNEAANLTLLDKMKGMYRTLQNRYNALGMAISLANIGIRGEPMVRQIIAYQRQIVDLVQQRPALALLGYQTEIEFASKAESLLGYVSGLTLSMGDINQMRASDRKLLFDDVLMQLSELQELSGNLVIVLTYSNLSGILSSLNPFQNYIDQDKKLVERIIQNAKYLKR